MRSEKMSNALKKITEGSWLYGAFLGFLPPYMFTILTIATNPNFRIVYYFRFILGIVLGALVGGFSASFATKFSLKLIEKKNIFITLLAGLVLGAACGILTLGVTPFLLLIQSSDTNWAFMMIKRMCVFGATMGSVGGLFFAAGVNYYLKEETNK